MSQIVPKLPLRLNHTRNTKLCIVPNGEDQAFPRENWRGDRKRDPRENKR